MTLEETLAEHGKLLNALVESFNRLHNDIDMIRLAQISHGEAIEMLTLRFDRKDRRSDSPLPKLTEVVR